MLKVELEHSSRGENGTIKGCGDRCTVNIVAMKEGEQIGDVLSLPRIGSLGGSSTKL